MKEYVLGFLFSENNSHVALVHKDRPGWQAGKINGIGGKVELLEYPYQAMIREFKEETGVYLEGWDQFSVMVFDNDILGGSAKVHCYRAFSDRIQEVRTVESEKIEVFDLSDVWHQPLLPNLRTLIPMALNPDIIFCKINHK